jgi:hypothetical protein
MKFCAICGMVKLNYWHKHFLKVKNAYNKQNDVDPGYTPYGATNCLLSSYTTTPNGQEIYLCLKLYVESKAPTHAKYVVFQSPIYMSALLSSHPLYI